MSKKIDLTGKRFGRLTVIGEYDKSKTGNIRWKCQCDCGNIIPVFKNTLLRDNGTIKSCGCTYIDELRKEIGKKKDFLEIIDVKQHGRKGRVVVKCKCGNTKEMMLSRFNNPSIHSCGCVGTPSGEESPYYQHGMSRKRIYGVHRDMLSRCYNQEDISYKHYGAKGVTICDEWLGEHGVENFAKWAYENGYDEDAKRGKCTLDRIDVNGNYEPSNCRWVDMKIQSNNKSNNFFIDINGVSKTLTEWCREYGVSNVQSVYRRIKKGMDVETALTKPMQKKKSEMTEEELLERKQRQKETTRKWREENREKIYEQQKAWNEANHERVLASKRKYEEKKELEKLAQMQKIQ